MQVQDIFFYPIKSLGGIRVSEADALQKGFRHDRRFMLIDEHNQFITQRVEHKLALLQTRVDDSGISILPKNDPQNQVRIPLVQPPANTVRVTIWDDEVDAHFAGENSDAWFSRFLDKPVRLVRVTEETSRPVDPRYAGHGELVSLADAYPYLFIGQASLDDLNSRLAQPVPMDRFRPNIVANTTEAFEEDHWAEIAIGNVHFKVAKPCARCVLVTIDQQTAEKGKEPMATLSRYRLNGKKVLFGQNLIALNAGKVKVGDAVEVLKRK